MDFLRRLLEAKLGKAFGMPVSMGGFSASPLSGRVEITDLAVGTMVRVKRVVVRISLARLLKKEVAIQSLEIVSPAIVLTEIPQRPPTNSKLQTNDAPSGGEKEDGWSVDLQQGAIAGGSFEFRLPNAGGYALGIDGIEGTIRHAAGVYEIIGSASGVGRRDLRVDLGAARLSGRVAGQAIEATLQVGPAINTRAQSAAMRTGPWEGSIEMTLAVAMLLRLLPETVKLPVTEASGEVTLSAAVKVDEGRRVTVERFSVGTGVVKLS